MAKHPSVLTMTESSNHATLLAALREPEFTGAVPPPTSARTSSFLMEKLSIKADEPEKSASPIWEAGLSTARRVLETKDPYATRECMKALREHLTFLGAQREDLDGAIAAYQELLSDAEKVDVPMADRVDAENEPFGSTER